MTLNIRRDDWDNDKQFDAIKRIAAAIERLKQPSYGNWTPSVRGDVTAGTYELSIATGLWMRIGNLVHITYRVILAGAITGGGSGNLAIRSLPFRPKTNTIINWWGPCYMSNVDFTGTYVQSLVYYASPENILFYACSDNAVGVAVPISGVAAGDDIQGSIVYETLDD